MTFIDKLEREGRDPIELGFTLIGSSRCPRYDARGPAHTEKTVPISKLSSSIQTVADRAAKTARQKPAADDKPAVIADRPPPAPRSTEDRLLNQRTPFELVTGGDSVTSLAAFRSDDGISDVQDSPEAIVDRVLSDGVDLDTPTVLAQELSGLDADARAAVIDELAARDPRTFDSNHWLNPANLQRQVWHDGSLSNSDAGVIADSIAAAWNRGQIPDFDFHAGVDESSLDGFGGGNGAHFAAFFNNSKSVEINDFRSSYASHVYDNYASPDSPIHDTGYSEFDRQESALVAAALVTGPGIPDQVAYDFYEQSFGPNGSSEFSEFVSEASRAHSRNPVGEAPDPFIEFANAAEDPGPYNYDISNDATRESIAVGLAEAVGRADTDPGFGGTNHGGVLETANSDDLNARLEAITEVFGDHAFAILDHLATGQGSIIDSDGTISTTHPSLVDFLRFTVGNTDLDNRETARDAAAGYFDHQVRLASDPNEIDRTAETRAINVASAASLASQDVVADAETVSQARRQAASFVLDTALSFVPFGGGRTAIVNSLTDNLGGSLPSSVIENLADELLQEGQSRLTSSTRNEVLDLLIDSGGVEGNLATTQEFMNLTINQLETTLAIENQADTDGTGVLAPNTEEAYGRIIDGAVIKANLGQ